jgi:hypothetical protein
MSARVKGERGFRPCVPLDQPQGQVQTGGHAAGRDQITVVDDAGRHVPSTRRLQVGDRAVVRRARPPPHQPSGGEEQRARADRREHQTGPVRVTQGGGQATGPQLRPHPGGLTRGIAATGNQHHISVLGAIENHHIHSCHTADPHDSPLAAGVAGRPTSTRFSPRPTPQPSP